MLDPELLKLLICPETGQSLILANDQLLSELNSDIQGGQVRNLAGVTLTQSLDGALIREDNQVLYPISDGIPALLSDEAIKLEKTDA
ncbi:MAG: hypothetical protein P8M53_06125 [Pirellulales bacterium]|mgnify:FL=1|nr:hypothetical protein [Pirellulales bacterium]